MTDEPRPTSDRVEACLRGEVPIHDLTPDERAAALIRATERYRIPDPAIDAAYAALPDTRGATERRGTTDAPAAVEAPRGAHHPDGLAGGDEIPFMDKGRRQPSPQVREGWT